ncbi:MAG: helix-turn-helix domain-containing protein [Methylococcales bacterium]
MKPEPGQIALEPKLAPSNSPHIPLGEYVRAAVEQYFQQINGYPACNLYEFVVAEVEKPLIETVLKQVGHNQSKAAKTLGISRSTLRKKIDRYGLE